jgi:hypothetical protein
MVLDALSLKVVYVQPYPPLLLLENSSIYKQVVFRLCIVLVISEIISFPDNFCIFLVRFPW